MNSGFFYLCEFSFTGKELDEETNLYYMSARYFSPKTGVWISADPAGGELVNPNRQGFKLTESTNWYSYCSNNPVNYTDPTGLKSEDVANGGAVAIPGPTPPPAATPAPETTAEEDSDVVRLPATDGNDTPNEFDWHDGGWHCDQDAYNNALEDGKDPGWVDPNYRDEEHKGLVEDTWEVYSDYEVDRDDIPANEGGYRFASFPDSDHDPGHQEYWRTDANGNMTVKKGSGQEPTTWVEEGARVGPVTDWLSPTYHYIILSDNE